MSRHRYPRFRLERLLLAGLLVVTWCRGAYAESLGATPHPDGSTTFRVWAPFAGKVSVKVNGGQPVALQREPGLADDDAVWSATVPAAKAGNEYKYVIESGGATGEFIDPRSKQLTGSDANASSVIVDLGQPPQRFQPDSFNKLVIYELHVGTFHARDADGKFNFAGAAEKLDYLEKLGVNAVKVMPVHENPELPSHTPAEFDWGYDPVHLFAVESSYGTPQDFKDFVRACHEHKIAVILDVVYNHLHPDNLLRRFGGAAGTGFAEGVYFYGDQRQDSGFGPRPDYGRRQVRDYVNDNALMWMREYGVDGLRWDSTVNIRAYKKDERLHGIAEGLQMMQDFNRARKDDPALRGTIAISEDLQSYSEVVEPIDGVSDEDDLGFNSQWDDDLYRALRRAVVATEDEQRDVNAVRDALYKRFSNDVFRRVVYSENHDKVGHPEDDPAHPERNEVRLTKLIDQRDPEGVYAKRRSALAAAVVLTAPGIPMIFQGQEMLDPRHFDFFTATPVDWGRAERNKGIVQLYRDLISLRRNLGGKTAGLSLQGCNVFHADPGGDKVLAYHRYGNGGAGDDVVVVANFANRRHDGVNIGFPRGGKWKVRFNSGAEVYDDQFVNGDSFDVDAAAGNKDGLNFNGNVALGPYGVVILSQD